MPVRVGDVELIDEVDVLSMIKSEWVSNPELVIKLSVN